MVSKVAERAVQEQIVEHMKRNSFFHPNQHAYRKGFSSVYTLLELSDQMYYAAELKDIGVAMSIDQSSGF